MECFRRTQAADHVGPPKLGTPFNKWIIFLYYFGVNFLQANGATFLWYFTNINFSYFVLLGIIPTAPSTFAQMAFGYFGDKLDTRWGRRKPLILVCTIIYMLCLIALANPPGGQQIECKKNEEGVESCTVVFNASDSTLLGWAVLFSTIMYSVSSGINIPLSSWLIESTLDNDDYVGITSFPCVLGGALGGLSGFIISSLPQNHNYYSLLAILACAIVTALMLTLVPNTQLRDAVKQPDLIPSLRTCMRSKEFRIIFYNKIVLFSAFSIIGGCLIYLQVTAYFPAIQYYNDVIDFIIITGVASAIGAIVINVGMGCVLHKYDKLQVYRMLSYLAIGIVVIMFAVSIPGNSAASKKTAFYLTASFGVLVAWVAAPMGMIDGFFVRDLIMFDQFITGLKRENMYQTALNLPGSLAITIAASVAQAIFFMSGFASRITDSNDDQMISKFMFNDASIWLMRVFSTLVAGVLIFASNHMIKLYPLNDKVANKLNAIVKAREEEEVLVSKGMAGKEEKNEGGVGAMAKQKSIGPMLDETNEDIMYMNNLSGDEIELINGNFNLLSSLKIKIIIAIIAASLAVVVNIISMGIQVQVEQGSYVILTMSIVTTLLFYLLYEILRLRVIFQLGGMLEQRAKGIFKAAHEANQKYYTMMKDMLQNSGALELDTGSAVADTDDVRMSLAEPAPEDFPKNNSASEPVSDRSISGYKRLIFFVAITVAYGIVGCTVLNYPQPNPDDHSPTHKPIFSPTSQPSSKPSF